MAHRSGQQRTRSRYSSRKNVAVWFVYFGRTASIGLAAAVESGQSRDRTDAISPMAASTTLETKEMATRVEPITPGSRPELAAIDILASAARFFCSTGSC
jgi:hypothetical protein